MLKTGEIHERLREMLLKIQVLLDVKLCRLDVLSLHGIAKFLGHFTELLTKNHCVIDLVFAFLHNTKLELSL